MGTAPNPGMFNEPPRERSFPAAAIGIAAVAIIVLVALFFALGHRGKSGAGDANYAGNLAVSNVQVSAANNVAGGTTVYVDGRLTNNGPSTVTAATLQASFAPNGGGAPQVELDQAKAFRTKDPIDLEPLSAQPLAPGASEDFRLIFEDVKDQWNQQTPQVKVLSAETK